MPWAAACGAIAAVVETHSRLGKPSRAKAVSANPVVQSCAGCGAPWERICSYCRRGADRQHQETSEVHNGIESNQWNALRIQYGHGTTRPELLANIGMLSAGCATDRGSGANRPHSCDPTFRPSLSGRGSNRQLQRCAHAFAQWWQGCARWLERAWSACVRTMA